MILKMILSQNYYLSCAVPQEIGIAIYKCLLILYTYRYFIFSVNFIIKGIVFHVVLMSCSLC